MRFNIFLFDNASPYDIPIILMICQTNNDWMRSLQLSKDFIVPTYNYIKLIYNKY